MSPADRDTLRQAFSDLGQARSLVALLRWALSHRDPPTEEAWAGLYIVASDAETEVAAVEKALREEVRR